MLVIFSPNFNGYFSLLSQVACIIILICFGASWTKGYMGLSISMLVYTTVIFIIFMCSFHTQMTFIHWGWTVRLLSTEVGLGISAAHPKGARVCCAWVPLYFERDGILH